MNGVRRGISPVDPAGRRRTGATEVFPLAAASRAGFETALDSSALLGTIVAESLADSPIERARPDRASLVVAAGPSARPPRSTT